MQDDMPAHVKSCLMGPSLTIPIQQGRLGLGTWQVRAAAELTLQQLLEHSVWQQTLHAHELQKRQLIMLLPQPCCCACSVHCQTEHSTSCCCVWHPRC